MDSDRELVLAIVMGLRRGLKLCHGMRRQLTEEEQFKVGREIAANLRLSNYRIEQGPPAPAHGTGWPGAATTAVENQPSDAHVRAWAGNEEIL